MRIEAFKPRHLRQMQHYSRKESTAAKLRGSIPERAALVSESWTLFDDDGEILYCWGALPQPDDSCMMWGFMSPFAANHMLAVTRVFRRFLEANEYARVDATVEDGFEPGHRWMRLLGFKTVARFEAVPHCDTPITLYTWSGQ